MSCNKLSPCSSLTYQSLLCQCREDGVLSGFKLRYAVTLLPKLNGDDGLAVPFPSSSPNSVTWRCSTEMFLRIFESFLSTFHPIMSESVTEVGVATTSCIVSLSSSSSYEVSSSWWFVFEREGDFDMCKLCSGGGSQATESASSTSSIRDRTV